MASRTSAFRYRRRDLDIRQIGRELNVQTVLEGSVRRAGSKLRVSAQLVNAADGYQIWSERYDREMADVFEIQDEITEVIVKTVAPTLLGKRARSSKRQTENLEAYELYLKGRHFWHQRTARTLKAAIDCLQQAIELGLAGIDGNRHRRGRVHVENASDHERRRLEVPDVGGSSSRQRFGSSPWRSSKMCFALAHHSPPPGRLMLRKPSADFQRQAMVSFSKFSFEI
ncbi:MAG TPA: hypothetical protein VLK65_12300 [Vicinamibacteria bacterium]|nr:hypothetical protein [Vicinamibacteria bacterium]